MVGREAYTRDVHLPPYPGWYTQPSSHPPLYTPPSSHPPLYTCLPVTLWYTPPPVTQGYMRLRISLTHGRNREYMRLRTSQPWENSGVYAPHGPQS